MNAPDDRSAAVRRHPVSAVPYLPGLDGLRAIAVIAVILYHADLGTHAHIPWMKGGFLGVEVFFVISGYLITLLMIGEEERFGSIFDAGVRWPTAMWRRIKAFWGRRFRRLLPAVAVLIVVVTTLSGVLGYLRVEAKDKLGWSPIWSLLYANNWWQIMAGTSYADQNGRPPLLRHLWSLAVEEQFYIVWPIVLLLVLPRFQGRHHVLGQIMFGIAALLAINTAGLYAAGVDWNILYVGTQSRISGILLGSSMAIYWRPYALARSKMGRKGLLVDALGVLGLAAIVWAMTHFEVTATTADGDDIGYAPLFYWGLPLVGVATVLVIASASHLGSWFGQRALSIKPLKWIGARSYGLYLWHWPVFQLMRPGAPGGADAGDIDLPFWVVFVLRCIVTALATEVSFRYIESPIRHGLLGQVFGRRQRLTRQQARRRLPLLLACAVCVVTPVWGTVAIAVSSGCTDVERSLGDCGDDAATDSSAALSTDPPSSAPPGSAAASSTRPLTSTPASTPGSVPTGASASATTKARVTVAPTTKPPTIRNYALGDSVMLGAQRQLVKVGVLADAKKNRQLREGVDVIRQLAQKRVLGEVVIVHLGTNGRISQDRVDEIMTLTKAVKRVIWVTVRVESKTWQNENNVILRAIPKRYPKRDVRVVDWNAASKTRAGIFCSDGIHLCKDGPAFYTSLIAAAIKAK